MNAWLPEYGQFAWSTSQEAKQQAVEATVRAEALVRAEEADQRAPQAEIATADLTTVLNGGMPHCHRT